MLVFRSLQTNSKADIASELESYKRQRASSSENESTAQMELSALQEAIAERDRTIKQLKEQIKYYIAFAENSINGHLDAKPRRDSGMDEEELEDLVAKKEDEIGQLMAQLQNAKVREKREWEKSFFSSLIFCWSMSKLFFIHGLFSRMKIALSTLKIPS